MNNQNKHGVRLLEYLFRGGSPSSKGIANDYCLSSGMSGQMGKIPRFYEAWSYSRFVKDGCDADIVCDDIALLLNEVVSKEENEA